MSFQGNDPNGTHGGIDNPMLPQSPEDIRIAVGSCYVAYLLVNGPITIRARSAVEQVIRTLGSRGDYPVSLIIQNNGGTIDPNTTQINFADGFQVTEVSPGIVLIVIPPSGITNAMLADNIVTAPKIANDAVGTSEIAASAVGTSELANGAVTPAKLDRVYRPNAQANPRICNFAYIGARTLNSNVSNQSLITVNFVPGVIYDGMVTWVFRGFATGGIPSNGTFTTNVAGIAQTGNPVQYDGGVDSAVTIYQQYTTAGGASLDITWGWNWTDGTLNITSASTVAWDFVPRV